MYTETEINIKDSEKINELRSSILNLKDHLFISDLKKDIKEFVDQNIKIDENQIFFQVKTIIDIPSWFPKAKLSRTQTDLIARSDDGEEYIFIDYFTNFRLFKQKMDYFLKAHLLILWRVQ